MDSPQRREVHFPSSAPPATGAPRNATTFPAPQHPQSAPSSYPPVPGQLYGHAGVARDAMFPPANAAGNHWPNQDWEDMPPPVENIAAQGQPQDLRITIHDQVIDNYAGIALDVPAQAQAAPPAPIGDPARNAAADPARAFVGEWPPQGPVPIVSANEIFRELAILYLREPNSQVAVIRMEPGGTHGVRVVITIELANP